MGEGSGTTVAHLATITSRPHALVIASALEHDGIPVWIDGVYHASVDPLSIALGGHRLTIPIDEWGAASALIREMGLPDAEIAHQGQTQAVMRVLAFFIGFEVFVGVPALIVGALPLAAIAWVPLSLIGIPVDPRGHNEFHLAGPE
mgnify:CR=1 FL=1